MPVYSFTCTSCELEFDSLEPVGTQQVACPSCHELAARQISSHAGYHIKGNNSASTRPKGAGSKKS